MLEQDQEIRLENSKVQMNLDIECSAFRLDGSNDKTISVLAEEVGPTSDLTKQSVIQKDGGSNGTEQDLFSMKVVPGKVYKISVHREECSCSPRNSGCKKKSIIIMNIRSDFRLLSLCCWNNTLSLPFPLSMFLRLLPLHSNCISTMFG